jgi:meso-butanediol dehydrogenase / (S,S)-butanediol dehydrogenase / diacetyl reductase
MARFDGRVALVTGGASGLGRAIVARLVSEGAQVVSLDRDAERGAAVAAELGAEFRPGDVTREADIVAAVEYAVSLTGRLDILCNNAGMQLIAPLHETTNEQWDLVHAVNVRSTFWGCKHALKPMREARSGAIVNTASISSFMGDPLLPAYTATKHAILGLTRSVGVHYAAEGIRCNCVCPGDMNTPMIEDYFAAQGDPRAARAEVEAAYPVGRIADPEEVAAAVAFLASDDASFINATEIVVDAGVTVKPY